MSESALVRLPNRSISDAELTEAPVALPVEADDEVNVGELARKLWRRKWAILLTIVTLMVLTTVVVFQLTPIYRAETFVMLEARQAKIANIQEVLAGLLPDNEAIQSEIQVIRSRDLAKKTIAKLGLDGDPEFNEDLRPNTSPTLFDWRHPEKWARTLLERFAKEPPTADEASANRHQLSRIVDQFLLGLTVAPELHSRVLRISFASQSMETLLARLAESHDLIVLDSAPTLAVSDALALCRFAEKTVFLIRRAETRQAVAMRGLRALVDAGADAAGVLLSIVDVKKHARYGYADSGLYCGRIREYYSRR
jgi:hypothetical protein